VDRGKQQGRRPLDRPRCRWVDKLRWILDRQDGVVWTGLAQGRPLVNAVMNLRASQNAGKLSNGYTTGGPLSNVELHAVN
jgi:hypothetical protein